MSFYFQTDEQEVINFLLTTEIIPLCLRIMESGSELSKTVSSFSNTLVQYQNRSYPQHDSYLVLLNSQYLPTMKA